MPPNTPRTAPLPAQASRLTTRATLRLFLPLSLSDVIMILAGPILAIGLARLAAPETSLAAYSVAQNVVLVIICVGLIVGLAGLQAAADGFALLRPQPYLDALRADGGYEALPDVVYGTLQGQLSDLTAAENEKTRAALHEAMPPEWVEAQFSAVLGDIFSVLRGRTTELSATIPLGEMVDRFLTAYGETAHPLVLAEMREVMTNLDTDLRLGDYQQAMGGPAVFAEATRYMRLGTSYALVLGGACLLLMIITLFLAGGLVGGFRAPPPRCPQSSVRPWTPWPGASSARCG